MNYAQLISSDVVREYFGNRYDKWRSELESLIKKASIQDFDIKDAQAEKKLLQTIKLSWMGFLLTYFWVAYHNGKGWLSILAIFSAISTLDLFLGEVIPPALFGIVPSVIFGMYGKSYILAAKVSEIAKTGALKPPSWGRVALAFAIAIVPNVAALLLLEAGL